ncbi:MAG: ornithine cyclodeaminase family protein [Thermoleophilia bacterium]|nr:ornithine cyclodeaminase family protein [Thermoleophilia bacterium]
MPVYVTEEQVALVLTPAEARAAVHGSFERLARGVVDNPARVRAEIPDGVFAVMPCVDRELGYAGLKTFVWLPGGTPFLIVLFSIERAELAAVVEAELLGRLRTAAASAVVAQLLARDGAATLGVYGCGRQAAAHVAALRDALPALERVVVSCPNERRLSAFCAEHGCEAAADACEPGACDVVVTATTAKDPVLRGEWLRDGALVLAIGANDPASRELDNVVFERATSVCTDSREQARIEAGDLIGAVGTGVLDWLEVHELQDAVVGEIEPRAAADDILVFKSNGLAAWDLAVAARVVGALS